MWRKLIYAILAIVVLFGVVVFAATRMIDAEQIKQLLVQQVSRQTGQQLVFEGDLSWRIFPTLGFDLGPVKLLNRGDFGNDPMLSLDHAGISVELLPLFSRQVNIGKVQVTGFEAGLVTLRDGRSNLQQLLDSLEQPAAQETPAQPAPQEEGQQPAESAGGMALGDVSIHLAGVAIEDASLILDDRQQGNVTKLTQINLVIEQFEPDTLVPVSFSASMRQPQMGVDLAGKTRVQVSSDLAMVRLMGLEINVTASGEAIPGKTKKVRLGADGSFDVKQQLAQLTGLTLHLDEHINLQGKLETQLDTIPRVRFELVSEGIDLDAFLNENFPPSEGEATAGEQPAAEPQEPDLTFLNSLDVAGGLRLGWLKVANLNIDDIRIKIAAKGGILTLDQLVAQLYEGSVRLNARVDGRKVPAHFSLSQQVKGVQVRPLLTDLAEVDLLSGAGNIVTELQGTGLTDMSLRRNLVGTVDLNFANGALYGINIPARLRSAKSALAGETTAEVAEEKTDFSELTATFALAKGIAKTENIKMLSPFIRVDGRGQTQLLEESLDFSLNTALVATSKGQGGREVDELKGVTIPLKIIGNWSDPKFRLAVDDVLKQRLEQEKQRLKQQADAELQKQKQQLQQKLQQEESQMQQKLQQQLQNKLDVNKLLGG